MFSTTISFFFFLFVFHNGQFALKPRILKGIFILTKLTNLTMKITTSKCTPKLFLTFQSEERIAANFCRIIEDLRFIWTEYESIILVGEIYHNTKDDYDFINCSIRRMLPDCEPNFQKSDMPICDVTWLKTMRKQYETTGFYDKIVVDSYAKEVIIIVKNMI